MVAILRNADGCIITFSEKGDDFILQPGETLETNPMSFAAYASRLKISAGGCRGETLRLPAGTPSIEVQVECPGETVIDIEINNEERALALTDGKGCFLLSLSDGVTYVIRPHDRKLFCAAGEALMIVVVDGPN